MQMKNSFLKMKKLISVAIITLVIALISIVCVVAVNHKSDKVKGNQETSKIIVGNASTMSAEDKYIQTILRMFMIKLIGKTVFGTTITHVPLMATHSFGNGFVAEINNPQNSITEKDCYYAIDNADDYMKFAKLTHTTVNVNNYYFASLLGHVYPYIKPYSENYLIYTFCFGATSLRFNFLKVEDCIYINCFYNSFYGPLPNLNISNTSSQVSKIISLPHSQMKVVLDNDITVELHADEVRDEQENIQYFAGVFDGQGHTIYFTGLDKYSLEHSVNVDGFVEAYSPFCSYLEGDIKNVRIDYSGMVGPEYAGVLIDNWQGRDSWVGGIVGSNKGRVYSCIVANPSVTSYRFRENAFYGALVGWNEYHVEHCIVEGVYNIYARNNIAIKPSGIEAYWGAALNPVEIDTDYVKWCLFRVEKINENQQWNKDGKDYIKSPLDIDKNPYDNITNDPSYYYANHEDDTSCYDVYTNSPEQMVPEKYNKLNQLGVTNISAQGGPIHDSHNVYWYFSATYSKYPQLRAFMTWQDMVIKSMDQNMGTVDIDKIIIPKLTTNFYGLSDREGPKGGGEDTYDILDQIITAIPNKYYGVDKWAFNNARTLLEVYFRFLYTNFITIQTGTMKDEDYKFGDDMSKLYNSYIVRQNSYVIIECDNASKKGYYYKSIQLRFDSYTARYDQARGKTIYEFHKTITLTINPKNGEYILKSDKEINDVEISDKAVTWSVPAVIKKEYNIEVQ